MSEATKLSCPKCGSPAVIKYGHEKQDILYRPFWHCLTCRHTFTGWEIVPPQPPALTHPDHPDQETPAMPRKRSVRPQEDYAVTFYRHIEREAQETRFNLTLLEEVQASAYDLIDALDHLHLTEMLPEGVHATLIGIQAASLKYIEDLDRVEEEEDEPDDFTDEDADDPFTNEAIPW